MTKAASFRALHRPGDPLLLFNIWDTGSAGVVAEAGAKALGTGSWSVAAAHGYGDGEEMPLDLAIANLERIVRAVDVPVTIDLEGGYGRAPGTVAATARRALDAGAVGCNVEDRVIGGDGMYAPAEQAARIAAIRAGAPADTFFINARTDLFLQARPDEHAALVEAALARGRAYAEAGADGFFVPGLIDERLIARVCADTALPVNIMVWPGTPPLARLAALGAARISHAGAPWRVAMDALKAAAEQLYA